MGLNIAQFRELIVRPALQDIRLYSEAAENLIVGTAVVESGLEFVKQKGDGVAVSVMQIEPFTYRDLVARLEKNYKTLSFLVKDALMLTVFPEKPTYLIWNLRAAVIFARLKYFFSPDALPEWKDYVGLAKMHKKIYNTELGATDLEVSTKIFRSVVGGYAYKGLSIKA